MKSFEASPLTSQSLHLRNKGTVFFFCIFLWQRSRKKTYLEIWKGDSTCFDACYPMSSEEKAKRSLCFKIFRIPK